MCPVVVLNCVASAKMSAMPIPDSKSGVIAASVMMSSWKFLRKSDHYSDYISIDTDDRSRVPAHSRFEDPQGHQVAVAKAPSSRPLTTSGG